MQPPMTPTAPTESDCDEEEFFTPPTTPPTVSVMLTASTIINIETSTVKDFVNKPHKIFIYFLSALLE
jgi:hypothetical protein